MNYIRGQVSKHRGFPLCEMGVSIVLTHEEAETENG